MNNKEVSKQIITKYKQYLRLEKSLSDNTVMAYMSDLEKLTIYLVEER